MPNAFQDDFSILEYEGWSRVAPFYDQSWSNATRQFIDLILDAAHVKEGMKVLDLACGPGYVSQAAHLRNAVPIGVDFSASMIDIAKGFYPHLDFVEGDAQALEFDDESFDAVVMNFGLLHLSKPELGIAEANRVLQKGGWFAFTVWAGPDRSPTAAVMFNNIMKYGDQNVNMPQAPPNYYFSDEKLTKEILQKNGFGDISFVDHLIEWKVPTAEFLFETELKAGVRASAFLKRQTIDTLAKIKSAVVEGMQQFYDGESYRLKFCGCVVAGKKK
jgi:ubiquinone/menaquinone biosynthesis C-methylase UbiE